MGALSIFPSVIPVCGANSHHNSQHSALACLIPPSFLLGSLQGQGTSNPLPLFWARWNLPLTPVRAVVAGRWGKRPLGEDSEEPIIRLFYQLNNPRRTLKNCLPRSYGEENRGYILPQEYMPFASG